LSFAIWTAANLIPRGVSHHAWYRRTFADYPANRRAVIPRLI
jgi:3-oxo-5-alpha-steroid 4-dehydrogenase 1